MKVPIEPLGERIVAVREEAQTKTAAGLYLPDNAKEKSVIAKVVAIGPGVNKLSMKVGDRVVYKEYSTTELKIDGTEYIIVKAGDILAKVA